jgi:Family of unknown function (DUF6065)
MGFDACSLPTELKDGGGVSGDSADALASAGTSFRLHAFRLRPECIAPRCAPVHRAWMEETTDRYANRCLPLLLANQAGWLILNEEDVDVTWTGGIDKTALSITAAGRGAEVPVSHFGYGILTWHIPFLFRTTPGYNLLVRGPSNMPKDGVSPLEGIIETDWTVSPFTMNWKLTRPDHAVHFAREEPICMIVPQRRGELEHFQPTSSDLDAHLELVQPFELWRRRRGDFLKGLAESKVPIAPTDGWQKDYFVGRDPNGHHFEQHQTKLHLKDFRDQVPHFAVEIIGHGEP